MKKYLVLTTNHGFRGRMWFQDDVVEFEEGVVPDKRYFELITKNTLIPDTADVNKPANTLADAMSKPFKKEPTAGEVLAHQNHPGETPLSDRDRRLINQPGNDL